MFSKFLFLKWAINYVDIFLIIFFSLPRPLFFKWCPFYKILFRMNCLVNKFKVFDKYLSCEWCLYFFSVYHMKETGWVKVSQTDVLDLHYQYQGEKAKWGNFTFLFSYQFHFVVALDIFPLKNCNITWIKFWQFSFTYKKKK